MGRAGGVAAVSDKIVALAEAGVNSMAVAKKVGLVLALVFGVVTAGAGAVTHQVLTAKQAEVKGEAGS